MADKPLDVGEINIPAVHIFHAHGHVVGLVHEGAIEGDDVWRIALVHDLELSHDSLPHLLFGFDVYDLAGHNDVPGLMPHLADGAAIARPQLFHDLQVLAVPVWSELHADFKGVIPSAVVAQCTRDLGIFVGRYGRFGRSAERQTLDVLALHGALFELICAHAGQWGQQPRPAAGCSGCVVVDAEGKQIWMRGYECGIQVEYVCGAERTAAAADGRADRVLVVTRRRMCEAQQRRSSGRVPWSLVVGCVAASAS